MTQSQLAIGLITLAILVAWIAYRVAAGRRQSRSGSDAGGDRTGPMAFQTGSPATGSGVAETGLSGPESADSDPFDGLEAKLERAFSAVAEGQISIADYRTRIEAERQTILRHRAALHEQGKQGGGDPATLETADEAIAAVDWCLHWADEMEGKALPS